MYISFNAFNSVYIPHLSIDYLVTKIRFQKQQCCLWFLFKAGLFMILLMNIFFLRGRYPQVPIPHNEEYWNLPRPHNRENWASMGRVYIYWYEVGMAIPTPNLSYCHSKLYCLLKVIGKIIKIIENLLICSLNLGNVMRIL